MEKKIKYIREDDPELDDASDYLNYLIDAYKQTEDMSYRNAILDEFEGYLRKYVGILYTNGNSVDIQNKDTKNFLRLFMKDANRKSEAAYLSSAGAYIHMIRRATARFSVDDIYHELIVHFLELLNKYEPIVYIRNKEEHRISFPHYIQVNIRYRLCRWIAKKNKDVITGRNCLEYNDFILRNEEPEALSSSFVNVDLPGWVWGRVATGPFSALTEAERYLLWLRYEGNPNGKKLSKRRIALITGYHTQTIVYRLDKIKKKIKKAIKEGHVLEG